MARIRSCSTSAVDRLARNWELLVLPAGGTSRPSDLPLGGWLPAPVPGTLASALRAAGKLDVEGPFDPLDGSDVWYRLPIDLAAPEAHEAVFLCFDGLATLAEVWLDEDRILVSEDMFLRHQVDVTAFRGKKVLTLRFRSVLADLRGKRPRPRWKARLVDQQQLRWIRTTLMGHLPGFCPPLPPVGPWREVRLERRRQVSVQAADLRTVARGPGGEVRLKLSLQTLGGAEILKAALLVGESAFPMSLRKEPGNEIKLDGQAHLASVERWWPHTHGQPRLYPVRARLALSNGASVDVDLGKVGFREIEADTRDGGFKLSVNGVPFFCRGACWTPLDVASPGEGDPTPVLEQVQAAGMNMLRVGGPFVDEQDRFHESCDEKGILVWQDFLLANMDYPADDPGFVERMSLEARQLVDRLQASPSLAVLCGGSEIEQQAAMMGLPLEAWTSAIFTEVLPGAARELRPDVPYVRASPGGGALPFHPDSGVAHYFGVGAYMRPLLDARLSRVRFATECLAFSNVPEEATVERLLGDGEAPHHHPRWKASVPRDRGAGWDFEDVRDHYLKELFDLDPLEVRYADPRRYLELSRATSCEVMAATAAEWRRPGSTCRGALVWFFRDFLPGAGFGVIDSEGLPKAAYHGLSRSMQPVLLSLTDEGLNGLHVHGVNDGPLPLEGELSIVLYRDGETPVASGRTAWELPAHGARAESVDGILGTFTDSAWAYRFGPRGHDLAVATLRSKEGATLATAFSFSPAHHLARRVDPGLSATARSLGDGVTEVRVSARRFAMSVFFDVPQQVASSAWFHLAPGSETVVRFRGAAESVLRGHVSALNASVPVRIET